MKTTRTTTALASLTLACSLLAPAMIAQTAGQDAHAAGQDTKGAAVNTGHAVKRTTKTGYHKSKSGTAKAADKTKEGTVIAADKTKEGTVKGFDKTKEGTEKVLHVGNHSKSVAKDDATQAHMDAKDNAQIKKDKAQANSPH